MCLWEIAYWHLVHLKGKRKKAAIIAELVLHIITSLRGSILLSQAMAFGRTCVWICLGSVVIHRYLCYLEVPEPILFSWDLWGLEMPLDPLVLSENKSPSSCYSLLLADPWAQAQCGIFRSRASRWRGLRDSVIHEIRFSPLVCDALTLNPIQKP